MQDQHQVKEEERLSIEDNIKSQARKQEYRVES